MTLSLSSKTSKAGVQPLKSCEPRASSANGASNNRSNSSRKLLSRPKVGQARFGRCHLVREFIIDFLSLQIVYLLGDYQLPICQDMSFSSKCHIHNLLRLKSELPKNSK